MVGEKRRLGRGLGALIPDAIDQTAKYREIPLEDIKMNPYQPRTTIDQARLKELADSIKEHGVIQAIIVSPEDEGYVLVAGERRFRAAQMAGLKTIPVIIKEVEQNELLEIALIENLQREDLNPVEEALAYQRLIKEFGFTQEELANRLGRSRAAIANTTRLLSLPESVREALAQGQITAGQARPLLRISEPAQQEALARKIINERLSAREAEKLTAANPRKRVRETAAIKNEPLLAELQEKLQHTLGTKVRINRHKSGGNIEIYYYGDEDLERLISLLIPGGLN